MAFCPICETVFPTPAELAAYLAAYVADLPAQERAPEAEMARRLALCQACPHRLGSTCRLCGCYVQARCAKARLHCPDVPGRW